MKFAPVKRVLYRTIRNSQFAVSSFLASLVSVYQRISKFFPPRCRYLPSCSEYMRQALLRHGLFRGLSLGVARIFRCHPWKAGGMDPVPREIEK